MQLQMSDQARDWSDKAKQFCDAELLEWEIEAEHNNGELPADVRKRQVDKAVELGFPRMDVPKKYGGLELSIEAQVAAAEQFGRITNALAWLYGEAQQWMFQACNEEQIKEFILPLMDCSRHECYAITEEGSGSDVASILATAHHCDDGYRLNGEKWYVTSANFADYMIFQGVIADGKHTGKHALFFVPIDAPGVELVETPLFSHTYAAHHPTYSFADVIVPAGNIIGDEADGMTYSRAWFRRERLMIAARSCGAAARLIEEATNFAQNRRIGDESLADKQAVQFMLADSVTELWAARLMTYEAARAHDRGDNAKSLHSQCSVVKLFASEMVGRVADRAVQIFGGRGYMRNNVAERFFREVRVDRIWEGTSEIQRMIIANCLYKRGLDGM